MQYKNVFFVLDEATGKFRCDKYSLTSDTMADMHAKIEKARRMKWNRIPAWREVRDWRKPVSFEHGEITSVVRDDGPNDWSGFFQPSAGGGHSKENSRYLLADTPENVQKMELMKQKREQVLALEKEIDALRDSLERAAKPTQDGIKSEEEMKEDAKTRY